MVSAFGTFGGAARLGFGTLETRPVAPGSSTLELSTGSLYLPLLKGECWLGFHNDWHSFSAEISSPSVNAHPV